jgi:hypothetical protein
MKKETFLLKLAIIALTVPILAICIYLVPRLATGITEKYPALAVFKIPFIIAVYATAVAFFSILYQAFRILALIEANQAFSIHSRVAIQRIKLGAMSIAVIYAMTLPLFYYVADHEDAPGILVIGLILIFAALVVAAFAGVLQKLVNNALEIKSEMDLTV